MDGLNMEIGQEAFMLMLLVLTGLLCGDWIRQAGNSFYLSRSELFSSNSPHRQAVAGLMPGPGVLQDRAELWVARLPAQLLFGLAGTLATSSGGSPSRRGCTVTVRSRPVTVRARAHVHRRDR